MKVLEEVNDVSKKNINEQRFKPSRYNHFFAEDKYILAYNAYTNVFARVEPKKYEMIKQILKCPAAPVHGKEMKKLKDDLIKGGFLIDNDVEEFETLKMQHKVGRYNEKHLGITIAPTLACNFRCLYCFETHQPQRMKRDVEKALIKFIEERLKHTQGLYVEWFGGEPLLTLDIIERLTASFKDLCRKEDVQFFPSSITTNGYLLSGEVAQKLKAANIANAQITLDGPPRIHDSRRPLINGKGTFEQILRNIKEIMDVFQVVVRVNIDKNNVDYLPEFYDLWESENLIDKVPFYFGHVRSTSEACSSVASSCFNNKEYSELVIRQVKEARKKGISLVSYPGVYRNGICTADKWNAFIVSPSGLLFKCWEEISCEAEHSIGDLMTEKEKPFQVKNLTGYMNWDPFLKKECTDCDIFPICAGGCPYLGLKYADDTAISCSTWKYNLYDMLKLKCEQVLDQRDRQDKKRE